MRLTRLYAISSLTALLLACEGSTAVGPESGPAEQVPNSELDLTTSDSWRTFAPMPYGRAYLAAAANNGILYAVGGSFTDKLGDVHTSALLQAYNLRTNTWSTRRSLPVNYAWGNGASFINGRLYLSGFGSAARFYMYDPATDRWTRKADLPMGQLYGSQGVINGQLYVYTGGTWPVGLARYNPTTNTWKMLAAPPLLNGAAAASGVIGGRLYIAGGNWDYTPVSNTWVYDPATNAWSARAPMPVVLTDLASAVIDKKLYVAGGATCSSWCGGARTLQVYDPVTDTWEVKAPMPTGRSAAAGAVAQGKFYVIGGSTADRLGISKVEAYTP
jgi:N-acetylneuraminic acid mutarotase